jgi:hypothetical protein
MTINPQQVTSSQQQAASPLYKIFGKVANASPAKFAWTHHLLCLYLMSGENPIIGNFKFSIENLKLNFNGGRHES